MPVIKHEPEFVHVDGYGACEVLVVPKLSSAVEHRHYTKESFTHPAKMSTMLCREIIRRYTKPSELVLDPMAGINTTGIEAALLGRNAIGVELEGKFVKMGKKNIKLLEKLKTPAPKGRATIIQGDSRALSKILKGKADVAVFSPPYADKTIAKEFKSEEDLERFAKEQWVYKRGRSLEATKRFIKKSWQGYPENEENIGNLPYKPVDAVVFSPPFARSDEGGKTGERNIRAKLLRGEKPSANFGGVRSLYAGISENPENIGNLKYGKPVDAIVTSPPYKTANEGGGLNKRPPKTFRGVLKKHSLKLSENPKNVDNIPYGRIDAIVTSPPYSSMVHKTGQSIETILQRFKEGKIPRNSELFKRVQSALRNPHDAFWEYAKQGYGGVDAVVMSPPYSGSDLRGKNAEARRMRLIEAGHDPKEFLGGVARNAVLKHYNGVDAVITSPPYSESMTKRRKGYTTHPQLTKTRHMGADSSDENIGNLSHGKVDAVITSPPYHDNKSDWDRKSRAAEEGEKVTYSDEIGRERKNIWNIHYYDQGKPLSHKYSKAHEGKETYLSAMFKVYAECLKVLRPGGRMVLVLKDFVRNKKVVRLDLDTKRLCEAAGFRRVETKLFRLPSKSFWRTLYSKKYPDVDTSLLRWEFVEVFERPMEACA